MYDKDMELNEEDLDNLFGGIPHEVAEDIALGNLNNEDDRRKKIEDLVKKKEELEYYNNSSSKTGFRR